MAMFLVVFAVFSVLILIMSVGVLLGREPIAGSCGGMSAIGMDGACDVCKGDKSICDDLHESSESAGVYAQPDIYDPSKF